MGDGIRYEEAVAKHEPLTAHEKGLVEGIYRYAWMRDGVFYVGTTGRTLGEAVDMAITEARARPAASVATDQEGFMADVERANEAAEAIVAECGVPETRDALVERLAYAYARGAVDSYTEAFEAIQRLTYRAIGGGESPDGLGDPSDAEIRL